MKLRLRLFYEELLNNYYHHQNYDEETSKRYAYTAIRNIIGIAIFMFSIVIFVIITSVFSVNINIKGNRLSAYLTMAILIVWFIYFCKKTLKPLFHGIEIKSEKNPKNNFFIILLFLVGIFTAVMFVIARIIVIYVHN